MARRANPLRPSKSAPRPERVAAFRLGLSAESRAAMLLIAKGHLIAARPFLFEAALTVACCPVGSYVLAWLQRAFLRG